MRAPHLIPLPIVLFPTVAHAENDSNIDGMLFGVLVMLAIAALVIWRNHEVSKAAAIPTNLSAATTDSLGAKMQLSGGPWVITFIRQSGNVHRVDTAATADEALRKVQASFRKAGIDLVHLSENTPAGFTAMRAIHNARGSAEGKKLGGVIVARG